MTVQQRTLLGIVLIAVAAWAMLAVYRAVWWDGYTTGHYQGRMQREK